MDFEDIVTVAVGWGISNEPQATLHYSEDLALGPVPLSNIGGMIEDLVAVRVAMRGLPPPTEPRQEEGHLQSFDDDLPPSTVMRDARLRLVLELTEVAGGGTYAKLRHVDQTVDYGPINVRDLPFLIETLLDDPVQVGVPNEG